MDSNKKRLELEKVYSPKDFEDKNYKREEESGSFAPRAKGDTWSIVMPPPNVTGILHMGHALNNSLQDILTRYMRQKGKRVLWLPGTDHAGIATQHVVERELQKEGLSRRRMSREDFLKRTWQVKDRHHDIITHQLRKISCSCDWKRERFTMDEGLSKAVLECFTSLYNKGLIYKGEYLVNYCPSCGTALADDEVEYKNVDSYIWSINYPLSDGSGNLTIATTRPETLFGDTAVAVHPEDERFKGLVGKKLKLPLTNREISIVADSFVDREFGSGAVKITPAHDPHDYDCAKRHNLQMINILTPEGTLNENVPQKYRGLPVLQARELVVKDLEEKGFLIETKPLSHEVGHCYRCDTIIEPYLSTQWFVDMKGMAKKALKALDDGKIVFHPKKWESTYRHWMENIRPWCISRQLWWGHRIPAWECKKCGKITVSKEPVKTCPHCKGGDLVQDSDVLDTWFSSWLWPFSTLGWPEKTADLKDFFPTNALVTAYDIIFFWVSRMIMASLEFMGKAPFKDIYITSLVRDKKGRKMSKSLGNGIDPIEIVDTYGSDAMRFTLCYLASQGQDIQIDKDSFKFGSKFANKVWNASRFLLMNTDIQDVFPDSKIAGEVEKSNDDVKVWFKWIYTRLFETMETVDSAFEAYKMNDAAESVYSFFWNDFCDTFIESTKIQLNRADSKEKKIITSVLFDVLKKSLVILHPFLPMLTEELWQAIGEGDLLINQLLPKINKSLISNEAVKAVEGLREAVRIIRNTKVNLSLGDTKPVEVAFEIEDKGVEKFFKDNSEVLSQLARLEKIYFDFNKRGGKWISLGGKGVHIKLNISGDFDSKGQIEKAQKDIKKAEELKKGADAKLANKSFIQNANPVAVEKERAKKAEAEEIIKKAKEVIELLKCEN